MILGTTIIPPVIEQTKCRSSLDYKFAEIADYKIHASALMVHIPFEEALVTKESIDDTIFVNDEETKLTIPCTIETQNYITAGYVGRAPLEFYGDPTAMGRQFELVCKNGNLLYGARSFGTEGAILGYNRDANENVKLPTE